MNEALQTRLNKRTIGDMLVAQTRENNVLREEWNEMLALNAELRRNGNSSEGKDTYLDASDARIQTLLDAITAPKPAGRTYVCELFSIGNPDFGQYHGKGQGSPTFTVETTLPMLVKIQQAYISVYNLGGGNCPDVDVYWDGVVVARISYNGRVWTPEKWPNCREVDPATGKEVAK